jgi:hypothetical protein
MKAQNGSTNIIILYLTGVRWGGWSNPRTAWKENRCPFYRKLGVPGAGLHGCGRSCSKGIGSQDSPARSVSLYRLSYPGLLYVNISYLYFSNIFFLVKNADLIILEKNVYCSSLSIGNNMQSGYKQVKWCNGGMMPTGKHRSTQRKFCATLGRFFPPPVPNLLTWDKTQDPRSEDEFSWSIANT